MYYISSINEYILKIEFRNSDKVNSLHRTDILEWVEV